ncbi:MAG: oxidoreductase [Ruminococcaceae bacterium]|nr:oxidoreductase [Oscillospiraceae bacterium]
MIYKDYKGKKLSMLGMGTMRLPTDDKENIDKTQVREMVAYAMEKGINYYDTAWGYHMGMSEPCMGEILSEYPRESYYLATKFPGYDLSNMNSVEEIFAKQQQRLKTDYFDFYLVHNVCDLNINQYVDPKYRVYDYLTRMQDEGKIRHLGFSVHGNIDVMKRFLEVYGDRMEFCQIQLNWLDYSFQDARAKLELLKEINCPVWVMEPLRGGMLCSFEKGEAQELLAARPNENAVSLAFRYLQSFDNIKVVLSGMSNFEQLKDNIKTFETDEPLTKEEISVLYDVAKARTEKIALPCTSCRYCTEHCPMELDIPKLISLYNEHAFTGGGFIAPMALQAIPEEKHPSACIGCRSCETVCPQMIKISEAMEDFAKKLK